MCKVYIKKLDKKIKVLLCLILSVLSFWPLMPSELFAQEASLNKNRHYLHDFKFSKDFFSSHINLWTEVLAHLKGKENINYLEIGVFEGGAAFWVAENILTVPSSKMTVIDIIIQDKFLYNLDISGFAEKTKIIQGSSEHELRKLPLASFDIIYVDGSSRSDDVLTDAVLSWGLLKPDGIIIFDNYDKGQAQELMPRSAIDCFINIFSNSLKVLHYGNQVVLQKCKIVNISEDNFYSFNIPSAWQKVSEVIDLENNYSHKRFVNIYMFSSFVIEINKLPPGKEDIRMIDFKIVNAMFKKNYENYEIISQKNRMINGLEAYQISYKSSVSDRGYHKGPGFFIDIYILKNSIVYCLSFIAINKDEFEKLKEEVFEDIIINSFQTG